MEYETLTLLVQKMKTTIINAHIIFLLYERGILLTANEMIEIINWDENTIL